MSLRMFAIVGIVASLFSLSTRADPSPSTSQPTTAATGDRAGILDEIKTDQDAIKSIGGEIAGFDKDAADAEALAKNPPATVADTDKPAYIDQRKNDEQMAQDSAREARERLTEAQKSLEDAKARLKALGPDEKKAL